MFNNRFFASKLGHAALVSAGLSLGAMITFAILSTMHSVAPGEAMLVSLMGTHLA